MYTRDEAFTIALLKHGPFPHRDLAEMLNWYGGGWGPDMLPSADILRWDENSVYLVRVEVTLREFGYGGDGNLKLFCDFQGVRA